MTMIELIARIVLVSLGLYFFVLMGAVGARAAASVIIFVGSLLYVRKLIQIGVALTPQSLAPGNCLRVMAIAILALRYQLVGTPWYWFSNSV